MEGEVGCVCSTHGRREMHTF